MKSKKLASVLCVCLLSTSMLSGCGSTGTEAVKEEVLVVGVPVETQQVEKSDFKRKVTLGGMTTAEATVSVIAKVSGMEQITSVNTVVGDRVTSGQVLATLNNDSSVIQLSNAQMAYDDAVRNYEQNAVLFEAGAVSQSVMDQLDMAMRSAENQLKSAQLAMDYSTVTAPISGTVTMVNADVGSYASASAPMFEIANVDVLEISTGINELNINKVAVGQEVEVIVQAISDQPTIGRIKEISKVMDNQAKNYPVTISIGNMEGKLLAGMYAQVNIVTDVVEDAIVIPVQAITNRDGQRFVMVEKDGKSYQKSITTGLDDGNVYVVLEGLEVGEHLVVKGGKNLVDGQVVTVVNSVGKQDESTANEEDLAPVDDLTERGDQ